MESGAAAPLSQSKGPGIDITPLYLTYPAGDLDVSVIIHKTADDASNELADLVAKVRGCLLAEGGVSVPLTKKACHWILARLVYSIDPLTIDYLMFLFLERETRLM